MVAVVILIILVIIIIIDPLYFWCFLLDTVGYCLFLTSYCTTNNLVFLLLVNIYIHRY